MSVKFNTIQYSKFIKNILNSLFFQRAGQIHRRVGLQYEHELENKVDEDDGKNYYDETERVSGEIVMSLGVSEWIYKSRGNRMDGGVGEKSFQTPSRLHPKLDFIQMMDPNFGLRFMQVGHFWASKWLKGQA